MMRMLSPRRQHGFSLLEILIAIGIFALFTLTLTRIMMGGMQTFRRGQAVSAIRADLRSALDLIAADFRQSTEVTTPSYQGGKVKSFFLNFTRTSLSGGTNVSNVTINYEINATLNRLTRRDLTSNQTVLVAENILAGPRLGEAQGADLSPSYFVWATNPNAGYDPKYDFGTMEVRLTGLKFEGQQQQRMSMVTQISQRIPVDLVAANRLVPKITLAVPQDLGRPGGLFFLGR